MAQNLATNGTEVMKLVLKDRIQQLHAAYETLVMIRKAPIPRAYKMPLRMIDDIQVFQKVIAISKDKSSGVSTQVNGLRRPLSLEDLSLAEMLKSKNWAPLNDFMNLIPALSFNLESFGNATLSMVFDTAGSNDFNFWANMERDTMTNPLEYLKFFVTFGIHKEYATSQEKSQLNMILHGVYKIQMYYMTVYFIEDERTMEVSFSSGNHENAQGSYRINEAMERLMKGYAENKNMSKEEEWELVDEVLHAIAYCFYGTWVHVEDTTKKDNLLKLGHIFRSAVVFKPLFCTVFSFCMNNQE